MFVEKIKKFRTIAIIFSFSLILKVSTFFPGSYLLAEILTEKKLEKMNTGLIELYKKEKKLPKSLNKFISKSPLSMLQ